MTYRCTAIFAKGDTSILEAARRKWKGCLSRSIDKPFQGIGIADPGADCCYPLVFNSAQEEEHERIAKSMAEELPVLSEKFPNTVFVFISADSESGANEFTGFAVSNGKIICKHAGKDALKKLVAYLDVTLIDERKFEPFTRGYFHICRDDKKT